MAATHQLSGETLEDAQLTPGVDWEAVRSVKPGEVSPLRARVHTPPGPARADAVRGFCAQLSADCSIEVWPHFWNADDQWEIDWEQLPADRPAKAEVAQALASRCGASRHAASIVLSTAVGDVIRQARADLEPGAAVVLDTDTTDLDGVVVEIAAATGQVLLDTLGQPRRRSRRRSRPGRQRHQRRGASRRTPLGRRRHRLPQRCRPPAHSRVQRRLRPRPNRRGPMPASTWTPPSSPLTAAGTASWKHSRPGSGSAAGSRSAAAIAPAATPKRPAQVLLRLAARGMRHGAGGPAAATASLAAENRPDEPSTAAARLAVASHARAARSRRQPLGTGDKGQLVVRDANRCPECKLSGTVTVRDRGYGSDCGCTSCGWNKLLRPGETDR